jgi:molybdopterin-containing oxidoreductase family iron-sulfur binding subunit
VKVTGLLFAGTALASVPQVLKFLHASPKRGTGGASPRNKWGMVIDISRCTEGCTECAKACRVENNVPLFGRREIDIHWIRIAEVRSHFPGSRRRFIPLMCQHCEDAPCVQLCPPRASFKRADGIVIVDKHRCIGCRYCMIACPFKARSFVFRQPPDWTAKDNKDLPKRMRGVVEKCSFCVHRVDEGRPPACVEGCPHGAIFFGDLNDSESDVAWLVANKAPRQLRPDLHLRPKVYYLGL